MQIAPHDDGNDDEALMNQKTLVAYRLGRVEKAVDSFNDNALKRDEKIFEKIEEIGKLAHDVAQNTYRIDQVESAVSNIYKFSGAVALAVVGLILEAVFNIV